MCAHFNLIDASLHCSIYLFRGDSHENTGLLGYDLQVAYCFIRWGKKAKRLKIKDVPNHFIKSWKMQAYA